MKKVLWFLTLAFCASFVFAQSVKPYVVDLSKMASVNEDKTAAFNKATKTVTVTANPKLQYGGNKGVYLWLNNLNISGYNIVRVKYKAIGDYGFMFGLDYSNKKIQSYDREAYCPSYLSEMMIPLKSNEKILNGFYVCGAWNVPYEQFVIESVSFEKVPNPAKTDVYASDEPPVVDTAANGNYDDKISAWNYVKKLGVGFQYWAFGTCNPEQEWGMDCFHPSGFKKPSKEIVRFIKKAGFKTLRLQTGSESHLLDENYTIDPRYIKALKEVVDWAIEEDMYVIVCGPFSEFLEKNELFQKRIKESVHYKAVDVSEDNKKKTEALLKAIWKQYATAFNNSYDEHLIFETLNEPIHNFHEHGWDPKSDCAVCKKDYAILNGYNQLIVDTIRSTGGNNAKRFIMVEGIGGKWKYIATPLFKMPKDKTKDRLIPTAHIYPMGFSMDPRFGGSRFYTKGAKQHIMEMFETFDKLYFKKNVPVYISEVGGGPLGIPVMERINCMKDFMAEAVKSGRSCSVILHPCNNYFNNDQDFDPWNIKWIEKPEYFNTIFYGAQGKEYPLSPEFIKKNETKVESIVGKNLLKEPIEKKNWGAHYRVASDIFCRATPAKYKIEFDIERTGKNPELDFAYIDYSGVWRGFQNTPSLKNIHLNGGVYAGNFKIQSDKLVLDIDSKLAEELSENSTGIWLNGQDIIIKSMKVVE